MDDLSRSISKDSLDTSPQRLEGESYEDYKKRRKLVNIAMKMYLKGKVVWPGNFGTYRKDSGVDLNKALQGDYGDLFKENIKEIHVNDLLNESEKDES